MSFRAGKRELFILVIVLISLLALPSVDFARKRRIGRRNAFGGQQAVVVDERLAAVREAPALTAALATRLSRGRFVSILGARRSSDGTNFYRVAISRRTRGWVQAEALASTAHVGDDARFLRLIRASEDFEQIARAHIFLEAFQRSPLRPAVLLLLGDAAEEAAGKLSRDAARRLDEQEMAAGGAPVYSYYMNFNGLDRYNRAGVRFVFDRSSKQFHYDGEGWREILRRYPGSGEASEARKRLEARSGTNANKPAK